VAERGVFDLPTCCDSLEFKVDGELTASKTWAIRHRSSVGLKVDVIRSTLEPERTRRGMVVGLNKSSRSH
jgi:hypothetical protein